MKRRPCITADVVKIVVFSPHRDDAAFSVGLSVASWLAAGHTVQVLNCFTQSAYAPFSDAGSLHLNDRTSFVSATRKREDIAWSKLLGGKLRITDLDLLDAPLRLGCTLDEVLSVPIRAGDRAVSRVAGSIAKTARQQFAVVLPLAIGGHIDHRVTRAAGIEALASASGPLAFYEDLPYAMRPGAIGSIAPSAEETGFSLATSFSVLPFSDDPQREERIASKTRMAECYDSQIDSAEARGIANFCTQYAGRERLWANAAWRESALAMPAGNEASA